MLRWNELTREDIQGFVENLGYEFIDCYKKNNVNIRVIVRDKDGYKFDIAFSSIGREKTHFIVGKNNPYSLENIHNWIAINEKPYRLTKNNPNGKISSTQELEIKCKNVRCGELFYTDWNAIFSQKHGCQYCANRIVGRFNNLEYLRPDLLKEWNFDRNTILPSEVTCGLNKKVWWICKEGHEWEATVGSRTKGNGCPYCRGFYVSNKNRLSILYPEIASEWHPNKNGDLTPNDVSYGSPKKVWWICEKEHIWLSSVYDRTRGQGCKKCQSSKGERKIAKFLNDLNIFFVEQKKFKECRHERVLPFDFYLPQFNLIIEYHGIQHYEPVKKFGGDKQFKLNKKRDKIKEKFCEDNNIPLLIIPYWEFNNIEQILTETLQLA